MNTFFDIEKLDIVIALLLIIIATSFFKLIFNVIHRNLSGTSQAQTINILIDKGYYDVALRKCETFISKRPCDANLLWLRATLYFKLDKKDKAMSEFQNLIKTEPLWKEDAQKYIDVLNDELQR